MKHLRPVLAAGQLWLLAASASALAQVAVPPTLQTAPDRVGRVIVSDKQAADLGAKTTSDSQKLSADVKDRLQRFERIRDAYLKEQEELRRRLRGAATEKERESVRELIKNSIDAWRDRSRSLREELKDRIAALRARMPTRQEILDDARENIREVTPERKRRGQD